MWMMRVLGILGAVSSQVVAAQEIMPLSVGTSWTYSRQISDSTGDDGSYLERRVITVERAAAHRLRGEMVDGMELSIVEGRRGEHSRREFVVVRLDDVEWWTVGVGGKPDVLRAAHPRYVPSDRSVELAGSIWLVEPGSVDVPFGRLSGVWLRSANHEINAVMLVPGIGVALEGHEPGPLECMSATTVSPWMLVSYRR